MPCEFRRSAMASGAFASCARLGTGSNTDVTIAVSAISLLQSAELITRHLMAPLFII